MNLFDETKKGLLTIGIPLAFFLCVFFQIMGIAVVGIPVQFLVNIFGGSSFSI